MDNQVEVLEDLHRRHQHRSMIVGLLLIVSLFVAISDFSHKWLDSETQNILYYDTSIEMKNSEPSESVKEEAANEEALAASTTQRDSMKSQNPSMSEDSPTVVQASAKSGKELEDDILNMLQENLAENNSPEIEELDDLEESQMDEIPSASNTMSQDAVKRDAQDIFTKFSNRR